MSSAGSSPPAKKNKGSPAESDDEIVVISPVVANEAPEEEVNDSPQMEKTVIKMKVEKWQSGQKEQFSAVHRFKGFPWRLCLTGNNYRSLYVVCEKSSESVLWSCHATAEIKTRKRNKPTLVQSHLRSWSKLGNRVAVTGIDRQALTRERFPITVELAVPKDCDGDSFFKTGHSTLDPFAARDGILVIGAEKKKVFVDKQSLAAQSPFFDRLFNGDAKAKNTSEFPIEDVDYEEFCNMIKLVYDFDGGSLTDENIDKMLQLSNKFELKVVGDCVINHVLSSRSTISLEQKRELAEKYNLEFLKENLKSE